MKAGRDITRAEIHEKTNRGFTPEYQKKEFEEGSVINRIRYSKNYSKMAGVCAKCRQFLRKLADRTDGSHCKIERCCK